MLDSALMDALFESYLDWKEACTEAAERYARWQQAGIGELAEAFCAYRAALAAEEDAAGAYQEMSATAAASLR